MATVEEIKRLQQNLKKEESFDVNEVSREPNDSYLGGLTSSALQGLTFGLSDEVGAAIGSIGSLFTDETFSQSFDRRLKESKAALLELRLLVPEY
jgi:hypothetical protein